MKTRYVLASLIVGSSLTFACEEKPSASPRGSSTPNSSTGTVDRSSPQSRAQSLIDQFNQNVRDKEYDAAAANLRELQSMKSDLPQSMQAQLAQLQTRLDNAKAALTSPSGTRSPSTANPPDTMPPSSPPTNEPGRP